MRLKPMRRKGSCQLATDGENKKLSTLSVTHSWQKKKAQELGGVVGAAVESQQKDGDGGLVWKLVESSDDLDQKGYHHVIGLPSATPRSSPTITTKATAIHHVPFLPFSLFRSLSLDSDETLKNMDRNPISNGRFSSSKTLCSWRSSGHVCC